MSTSSDHQPGQYSKGDSVKYAATRAQAVALVFQGYRPHEVVEAKPEADVEPENIVVDARDDNDYSLFVDDDEDDQDTKEYA